jgi:hypothetical protein
MIFGLAKPYPEEGRKSNQVGGIVGGFVVPSVGSLDEEPSYFEFSLGFPGERSVDGKGWDSPLKPPHNKAR